MDIPVSIPDYEPRLGKMTFSWDGPSLDKWI